jgi:L-asparaginase II
MVVRSAAVRSTMPRHAPLVAVVRGDHVESVHHGSIAVVDRAGRVLYRAGDPDAAMFTRSTLKPLQAVPLVAAGGLEKLGLDLRALALMCASHNGEPEHVRVAEQILAAADCRPEQLQCGTHIPMFYLSNGNLPPAGEVPTVLQHNCSGKHAGMLALCRLRGFDTDGYTDVAHPVQATIREAVAAFAGVEPAAMSTAPDGCSVPNYGFPLTALAQSYARLAAGGRDPVLGDIPARIFAAMTQHAFLISGTGRQDAAITEAGSGDWISKIGGEGIQTIGIRSRGIGIAIKIADGDKGDYQPRATFPAAIETLRQLGVVPGALPDALRRFDAESQSNNESRFRVKLETVFTLAAA